MSEPSADAVPESRADQGGVSCANSAEQARASELSFGPKLRSEGGVLFRLFAPAASSVRLATDEQALSARELTMQRRGDGWHELAVDDAGPGTRYRFVLPNGMRVPDPASRYAPVGVHGPSEVVDPDAFR